MKLNLNTNNSRYNNYWLYTHDKNCQHYRIKYIYVMMKKQLYQCR